MRTKQKLKTLAVSSALFLAGLPIWAQPSAADVSATLGKLFGGHNAFSTRAEIKVTEEGQKEGSLPLSLAWLEGKVRAELDLGQIKSHRMPADLQAGLKKAGLEKIIAVILPKGPLAYIISPGLKGYAEQTMPKPKSESADKPASIKFEKTAIGNETIDGHPCVKNKVVVGVGDELQELTLWSASDMKDFPLKMQMDVKGSKVSLSFKDVKLTRPDAKVFEAPEGFTKHSDAQGLLAAAMAKFAEASAP